MTKRPTVHDVAARAGLHPATVSRALDPARAGRVTAATSSRVIKAAAELGYRPNHIARSLRTQRSNMIGIVIPDLGNPAIPPIVRGIEDVLWQAGFACVLADTDNVPERESELVTELRDRGC
ncbi:MAG: LacI family DNA-binding transcriptional regulator, partial [Acidimicrobiales bacterium]